MKALFSVPVHKEMIGFAKGLVDAGWEIIATRDAADELRKNNINCTTVSDYVDYHVDHGFPPTLHPKMEWALTVADEIQLVYDIPYTDGNDVGGTTLLALAAKGKRLPVFNSGDMKIVLGNLDDLDSIRDKLIRKANRFIASHYHVQARDLHAAGRIHRVLMNGENPYQVPAYHYKGTGDSLSLHNFNQLSGEAPCFTNVADFDSILETMCRLSLALEKNMIQEMKICIAAKHGNPCGVGVSKDAGEAIEKALWGNPKGIWGGEVITNFKIDEIIAEKLYKSEKRKQGFDMGSWMLDVIAAPEFTEASVNILGKRKMRKLFSNQKLLRPYIQGKDHYRQLRGGFLIEPHADYVIDLDGLDWTAKRVDNIDLIIAWAVCFTSFHGGNEVAIAKDNSLLSCAGGPSTYDAAVTAVNRAKEYGHDIIGSAFGADAFFPFKDVPEHLFQAGCVAGTVPKGAKRDNDVIGFFKSKNMAVGFMPEEIRGFCRH